MASVLVPFKSCWKWFRSDRADDQQSLRSREIKGTLPAANAGCRGCNRRAGLIGLGRSRHCKPRAPQTCLTTCPSTCLDAHPRKCLDTCLGTCLGTCPNTCLAVQVRTASMELARLVQWHSTELDDISFQASLYYYYYY